MQVILAGFPPTLTFISLCGMSLMPLSGWIGLYRGKIRVLRGDGNDPILFKRIRMHGNFIENAPITALALAAAEGLGLAAAWLWMGVVSFVAGRILHFVLYDSMTRGISMGLTTLPALAWSVWILWRVWFAG